MKIHRKATERHQPYGIAQY